MWQKIVYIVANTVITLVIVILLAFAMSYVENEDEDEPQQSTHYIREKFNALTKSKRSP